MKRLWRSSGRPQSIAEHIGAEPIEDADLGTQISTTATFSLAVPAGGAAVDAIESARDTSSPHNGGSGGRYRPAGRPISRSSTGPT
jgi:hypothetical protein